ncbi:MAG TPA: BON domain-containing protein [Pirellulales bacterium]|nr:BON domain-containing protein [Pirellulales bacterium]
MADSQLTQRLDAVLRSNPHIPHRNLRFEANQGQVVLRGTVRSYYQKLMAQEALLGVEGVEGIENQLEVQWRM